MTSEHSSATWYVRMANKRCGDDNKFVRTRWARAPNVVKVNSVCWVRRINGVEEVGVKHGKKTYGIECCWRLEELGGMRGLCLLSVIALLLTTIQQQRDGHKKFATAPPSVGGEKYMRVRMFTFHAKDRCDNVIACQRGIMNNRLNSQ